MSIASTSHHLRLLYKNEVLDFYKDGKMAYYFIKDDEIREFFSKNQEGFLKRVENEFPLALILYRNNTKIKNKCKCDL